MSPNVGMAIWGGVFSHENTSDGCTGPHKSLFSPHKQVSVRNCYHEWLRTTNTFILCDLFWIVQKSHARTQKEALIFHEWLFQFISYELWMRKKTLLCEPSEYLLFLFTHPRSDWTTFFTIADRFCPPVSHLRPRGSWKHCILSML